jgi:GT2 family glycosyltransferase
VTEPKVCVVVPTYNGAHRLHALLEALDRQTLPAADFEVVVVDDCSTDTTWNDLERLAPGRRSSIRVMRTAQNSGGPAAPRNLGWRSSRAHVIAFLDDDCLPEPDWLAGALAVMEADSQVGVLQGRTIPPPDFDFTSLGPWHVVREVHGETPWFEATNIFYRRSALEQVGGFDEYLRWWGEDTDLGWKVVEAGWRRGFTEKAVVIHEVRDRGWRWAARFGWLDRRTVIAASVHPRIRTEGFWKPWAFHRQPAELALALVGLGISMWWRPAALLSIPYAWDRCPPVQRPSRFIPLAVQSLVVDAASLAGHLSGSLESGIFVL